MNGIIRDNEVYIPFSLVQDLFPIYGKVKDGEFEIKHSDEIHRQIKPYKRFGNYLNMEKSHIETWDNIFDGNYIPKNTNLGYEYYPISIAHLGLSHYSALTLNPKPCYPVDVTADPLQVVDFHPMQWSQYMGTPVDPPEVTTEGVRFRNLNNGHSLLVPQSKFYYLEWKHHAGFRIYLEVATNEGTRHLQFDPSNEVKYENGYYLLGIPGMVANSNREWKRLIIDPQMMADKLTPGVEILEIKSLKIRGDVTIRNLGTLQHAHKEIFLNVADWFLDKTDTGRIYHSFDHDFYAGRTETLTGHWLSAMAQGMAISVLLRAYGMTLDLKYLDNAKKMADNIPTATFNGCTFYEEYPTNPPSLVLNGHIFCMIGLYDLQDYYSVAKTKFNEGMTTLEKMLPYYDLGYATAYDLTHIYNPGVMPNIARWQYHLVVVNQLKLLNTVVLSQVLQEYEFSWEQYMFGNFAETNGNPPPAAQIDLPNQDIPISLPLRD